MTRTTKYLSASILILGLALAAASQTAAQDTSGQPSRPDRQAGPGRGGRGRFGGPGGPGGRFGGPLPPMALDQLGATEAQRQAIRTIEQSHDAALRGVRERERSARQGLQSAMMAETVDEGAIRARSADVAAVEADAAVLQARVRSEVFAVLTPEQRAQASTLRHARGRGRAF